ncbi:uncharacterized protein LOC127865495 [Dreissena polymorpha]|uniref:uncharacterized protein LOC127865495 n=1 Tax=Dreissena polymorpha TaxID=45954 RepID=UPI002263DDB7|nr:uncharacterized protein LOC127865495 [Dreissena polymorpha]
MSLSFTVTDVQRQCALKLIGQSHENIGACLDDDPLYSRVKDNMTSSLRCPETDANTRRGATNGPADISYGISLDDDPLYSSVVEKISTHEDEKGACGYTEQV